MFLRAWGLARKLALVLILILLLFVELGIVCKFMQNWYIDSTESYPVRLLPTVLEYKSPIYEQEYLFLFDCIENSLVNRHIGNSSKITNLKWGQIRLASHAFGNRNDWGINKFSSSEDAGNLSCESNRCRLANVLQANSNRETRARFKLAKHVLIGGDNRTTTCSQSILRNLDALNGSDCLGLIGLGESLGGISRIDSSIRLHSRSIGEFFSGTKSAFCSGSFLYPRLLRFIKPFFSKPQTLVGNFKTFFCKFIGPFQLTGLVKKDKERGKSNNGGYRIDRIQFAIDTPALKPPQWFLSRWLVVSLGVTCFLLGSWLMLISYVNGLGRARPRFFLLALGAAVLFLWLGVHLLIYVSPTLL